MVSIEGGEWHGNHAARRASAVQIIEKIDLMIAAINALGHDMLPTVMCRLLEVKAEAERVRDGVVNDTTQPTKMQS